MAPDIADAAHLRAVVAFAGREGSLDLAAKLRYLDAHRGRGRSRCVLSASAERMAVDVAMFERRRGRWAPVFTGRLAPTRGPGGAAFALTIAEATRR